MASPEVLRFCPMKVSEFAIIARPMKDDGSLEVIPPAGDLQS